MCRRVPRIGTFKVKMPKKVEKEIEGAPNWRTATFEIRGTTSLCIHRFRKPSDWPRPNCR